MAERTEQQEEPPRFLTRRRMLAGGAVAGIAAGVGYGVWRERQRQAEAEAIAAAERRDGLPIDHFKATGFTDHSGNPINLKLAADTRYLFNFWATWCPPCLHEMPLFDAAFDPATFPLYGLAVDDPENVRPFLDQNAVGYPILVAGLKQGVDLMLKMGNRSATMPYTCILGTDGRIESSKSGPFATREEIVAFFA